MRGREIIGRGMKKNQVRERERGIERVRVRERERGEREEEARERETERDRVREKWLSLPDTKL